MTPSLITAGRELRALLDATRQAQGLARTRREAQLHRAVADIEQAAIQASCETHLLVGQQAQAFVAAAPPLGRGL